VTSRMHAATTAADRELGTVDLGEVLRIPRGSSLAETARLLRARGVSAGLVGDAARDVVTERDLAWALAQGLGPADQVESVLERTPAWTTTSSHVIDAAHMMLRLGVHHLVVLRVDGRAAGVLSMHDVLALIVPDGRIDAPARA